MWLKAQLLLRRCVWRRDGALFQCFGVRSLTQLSRSLSACSAFALRTPAAGGRATTCREVPLRRRSCLGITLDNPAHLQGLPGCPGPGLLGVDRVWDLMGLTAAAKAT